MVKIYFLLLGLSLFATFSVLGSFQGNQRNKRPRTTGTFDKYADNRKNANDVLNDPAYIVGNSRSVTKKDWVYKHSPRSGSLFIRTASGKVLYPGELNTVRNAVKFQDFIDDFLIKLPNAKLNTKYTLVAYSEGYLAKAVANIPGENLFAGIQGDKLGNVFQGVNKDELGNIVVKDTKYCIEILEQNPNEQLSNVGDTKSDWHDPKHRLGKELNGTAGKTCFVVLPKGMEELENDFYSEFELIIATFESHMKQGPTARSAVGPSGDAASKIATSVLDDAINRQQTMFVGSPRRNSLYSNDFQNYGFDRPQNYGSEQNYLLERPQNYRSEEEQNYRPQYPQSFGGRSSQQPQSFGVRSSQQPQNFGYRSPQQQPNFQRSYSLPNLSSSTHMQ